MKHFWRIVLVVSILFSSIVLVEWNIFISAYKKNMSESDLILKDAYEYVRNDNNNSVEAQKISAENGSNMEVNNIIENTEIADNNGIIGILIIPSLNIEAPVKDGTSQEVMRTAIGHFIESDYWNGNVSLASHNSGTSAHYFEKISKLNENDEIEYITKSGAKKYKVKEIKTVESTDWSMVLKSNLKQTENNGNTITLITCITGKPKCRLCVRGVEEI